MFFKMDWQENMLCGVMTNVDWICYQSVEGDIIPMRLNSQNVSLWHIFLRQNATNRMGIIPRYISTPSSNTLLSEINFFFQNPTARPPVSLHMVTTQKRLEEAVMPK